MVCVPSSCLACAAMPQSRSSTVMFLSSLLFCGPGGIAGHVEQHCAQVWHHTQRAGSAQQAVLQSSGAWPGVNRRARLHSSHPTNTSGSFRCSIVHSQWFAVITKWLYRYVCEYIWKIVFFHLLSQCNWLTNHVSVCPNCLLITASFVPLGCSTFC